jgi:hypothetical protein
MGLAGETDRQGNLGDRPLAPRQQCSRSLDPAAEHVLMRGKAREPLELASEVHGAEASLCGQCSAILLTNLL